MQRHLQRALSGLLVLALVLTGCGGGAGIHSAASDTVPQAASDGMSPSSDLAKAVGDPAVLQEIIALRPGQTLTLPGKGPWTATQHGIQPQCTTYLGTLRRPQCASGGGYETTWIKENGYTGSGTWNGELSTTVTGAVYDSSGAQQASHAAQPTTVSGITVAPTVQVTIPSVSSQPLTLPGVMDNRNLSGGTHTLPNGWTVNLDTTNNVATVDFDQAGYHYHVVGNLDPDGVDVDATLTTSNGVQVSTKFPLSGAAVLARTPGVFYGAQLAWDPRIISDVGIDAPLEIAASATLAQKVAAVATLVAVAAAAVATYVPVPVVKAVATAVTLTASAVAASAAAWDAFDPYTPAGSDGSSGDGSGDGSGGGCGDGTDDCMLTM